MALPASGAISLADVNTELGLSSTAQIDMNSSAVRTLFAVPSGAISMSNGYGKANQFAFTISSNQTNANLATLATAAGWNGTSKVVATIGSGVYISSNSTGTPALTISGSFPGGVELINNGYIVGMGGAGGNAGGTLWYCTYGVYAGTSGAGGGTALSTSLAMTVTNNGTIAGGGGGGGGGGCSTGSRGNILGGGGGGGRSSAAANSAGGSRGYSRYCGQSPNYDGTNGSVGTVSSAGGGGAGSSLNAGQYSGGTGGTGGGWGATGSTGGNAYYCGYGCNGFQATVLGTSGGSGGNAVSGNSNITWVATGTRLGGIS